ncbi:MAG: DNA polymerase III subunit gamma/tau [Candidatus Aminicenantes bacterium]|nr:DNA polymerase III subunit gamma/tau [Candidatus Aminicenantes bacterium]
MKDEKYQIFARKYRPKIFEKMIGQKAVVQTLQNAVRSGRLAQAYLFSGMRGVGKTTAARILAKALNCEHGPIPTPCNECEHCREIDEDRSIDVLEIDGASNRQVADIDPIRDTGKYKPIHSRYKIIYIDEVHMLSKHAFNALLKILEEPPPSTIFIFATTEFHSVPATIVSRCQHFEFKKVSQRDLINHLNDIAKKEGLTISSFGLSLIADASEGSIRDAQSLLDQAVSFCGENIGDQDLKEILGSVNRDLLFEFSGAVFEEKPERIFALVEKVIEAGHDLRFFYKELVRHFRNLLIMSSVSKPEDFLVFGPEDLIRLKEEAAKASQEELLRYLQALQNAEQGLRFSSHPQIYFETVCVKLCHYKKIIPLKDVIQDLDEAKKGGGTVIESRTRPPAPTAAVPTPPPRNPVARSVAQARPSAMEMHGPPQKQDSPPSKIEKDLDIAMKDPVVRSFMDKFKARVVSVEPLRRKGEGEED